MKSCDKPKTSHRIGSLPPILHLASVKEPKLPLGNTLTLHKMAVDKVSDAQISFSNKNNDSKSLVGEDDEMSDEEDEAMPKEEDDVDD